MYWFWWTLWFGYSWPSLKGNGPEALIEMAVVALVASILYPPIRHAIKREFEKIHHKLDHVISGSEEAYIEPEWKEFEHWIVTGFKWLTKPFRKKTA